MRGEGGKTCSSLGAEHKFRVASVELKVSMEFPDSDVHVVYYITQGSVLNHWYREFWNTGDFGNQENG